MSLKGDGSEMLEQFPFVVRGFHSDNGSEYIHHAVPRLQEVLRFGVTAEDLQTRAAEQSDTEAALSMQQAKRELFRRIGRKIA
ncbi:MAG: hypothetical protein ACUVXB_00285 [Bryobacteraceae bacterium]